MILVDTSAWVEFDRGTGSVLDRHLAGLIEDGSDIGSTDPVLMEVLAGARSEGAATQLRRLLTSFNWIPALAPTDFEGAARIYRSCRHKGFEPGGMIDCMIAAVAIRTESSLLTRDAGFGALAQVVPLELEPVAGGR